MKSTGIMSSMTPNPLQATVLPVFACLLFALACRADATHSSDPAAFHDGTPADEGVAGDAHDIAVPDFGVETGTPADEGIAGDAHDIAVPDFGVETTGGFLDAQATRVSIEYSCFYLGSFPRFHCVLNPARDGTWVTEKCTLCKGESEEKDMDCQKTPPIALDGVVVPADRITGLLGALDGLPVVGESTRCDGGTDNYPGYHVEIAFVDRPSAVIGIGGNCGPFFVQWGGVLGCDCGHAIKNALWALFGAITPELGSTLWYDHGPNENCSCTSDFGW
jgi:hypothetical protein